GGAASSPSSKRRSSSSQLAGLPDGRGGGGPVSWSPCCLFFNQDETAAIAKKINNPRMVSIAANMARVPDIKWGAVCPGCRVPRDQRYCHASRCPLECSSCDSNP